MPGLILHIGMHKTGSSALQRFFRVNRLALWLAGVSYPEARAPDGRALPKQNDLFLALSHERDHGRPHAAYGPSAALVARLGKLARRRRVLVSAEGLSGEWPGFAAAFAPLRGLARVVVFVRAQADWAPSFYRQLALRGDPPERRPFEAWMDDPATRAHLDYAAILGWWGDALGDEAVRVVPYPPAEGLVPSFLAAAGLPAGLAWLPRARARVNVGPGDAAFAAATGLAPPRLPPGRAAALRAACADGNEALRRRFRPDLTRLFDG